MVIYLSIIELFALIALIKFYLLALEISITQILICIEFLFQLNYKWDFDWFWPWNKQFFLKTLSWRNNDFIISIQKSSFMKSNSKILLV